LDDNWQECGAGVHNGFHDAGGNPIINKTKFPNMTGMVAFGHVVQCIWRFGFGSNFSSFALCFLPLM
jgi:hypothetical protein